MSGTEITVTDERLRHVENLLTGLHTKMDGLLQRADRWDTAANELPVLQARLEERTAANQALVARSESLERELGTVREHASEARQGIRNDLQTVRDSIVAQQIERARFYGIAIGIGLASGGTAATAIKLIFG